MKPPPSISIAARLVPPLGLALAGGYGATLAGLPLPWMLGSLIATAALAMSLPVGSPFVPSLPDLARKICIGVIGVMVGGTFTPGLFGAISDWWPSLVMMFVVTVAMQAAGYGWFRRGMGYDAPTAWFSAAPGGFVEAISFAEAHGGDLRIVSTLQFLRIVIVVLGLPLAYSIWTGAAVGSAAGMSLGDGHPLDLRDGLLLIASLVAGIVLGTVLHIPAGAIVGPMLVSGVAHATGLVQGQVPYVVMAAAQLMIGATLGLRFAGLPRRHLALGIWASIVYVVISGCVVAVGIAALSLLPFPEPPPEVLLLSFVPGGVVEMGLIALSLGANPVFVTTHHVFRILIAVILLPRIYIRRVERADPAE